jgi:hypothetical protein
MPRIPVPTIDTIKFLASLIVVNHEAMKKQIDTYVDNFCEELHNVGYEASDFMEQQTAEMDAAIKEYFAVDDIEDIELAKLKKDDEDEEDEEDDSLYAIPPAALGEDDEDEDDLDDYIKQG